MDDFSNYPESLTERKSANAAQWTARDAIIAVLRDIDKGELPNIDCIVISYRMKSDEPGVTLSGYTSHGPDVQTSMGLLQTTMFKMWDAG